MKYLKYFESSEKPLYPEDGESLEDYFTSVFDGSEIKFSRMYGTNDTKMDTAYVVDLKFIVDSPKDHGPYEKANLKFLGEDGSEMSSEIFDKFRDPMAGLTEAYISLKKTKLIKWIEKSSDYKLYMIKKNLKFKYDDVWGYDIINKMDMYERVPASVGCSPGSLYKFIYVSIRFAFYKKVLILHEN